MFTGKEGYISFCVLLLIFFTGCTSSSKLASKKISNAVEEKEVKAIAAETAPFSIPEVAEAEVEENIEQEPLLIPYRELNFTEYDKSHVRTVDHNPFDVCDTMCVSFGGACFSMPLPGAKVISQYMTPRRPSHTGVDLKTFPNDTIRSVFAGVVRMSQPYSGYGNVVVIRHYNGLETVYSHNAKNLVRIGDCVCAGQPIAFVGRTGRATTEHLHFEVRIKGEHINPNRLFDFERQKSREEAFLLIKRGDGYALKNQAEVEGDSPASPWTAISTTVSEKTAPTLYTVQKGDTLYAISRKFNISLNYLCELNRISLDKILPVGMKLKVLQ